MQEKFFESSDELYAEEIIKTTNQKYDVDDYTIMLEEVLYDKKTNIGYCVFSITKQDGIPEIELNKWGQSITNRYGKNGRFFMRQFASQESKFEIVGDTLYQYFSFRADSDFNGKVKVVDSMNENKQYEFTLPEIDRDSEYIVNKNTTVSISPIGMVIDSDSEIKNIIILHYKDGTEEEVYNIADGIGVGKLRVGTTNDRVRIQCVFEELKKIENIDYVLLNGKKIQ